MNLSLETKTHHYSLKEEPYNEDIFFSLYVTKDSLTYPILPHFTWDKDTADYLLALVNDYAVDPLQVKDVWEDMTS